MNIPSVAAACGRSGAPRPCAPHASSGTGSGEDLLVSLVPFIMVGVIVAAVLRKLFGMPGAFLAGAVPTISKTARRKPSRSTARCRQVARGEITAARVA